MCARKEMEERPNAKTNNDTQGKGVRRRSDRLPNRSQKKNPQVNAKKFDQVKNDDLPEKKEK